MKKILLITVLISLVALSCIKPKTKVDILTKHTWELTACKVNPGIDMGNGTTLTDLFAIMDNCTKTSTYKFNTEGKRLTINGCNSDAVTTDTWSFVNNETALDITTSTSRDTAEIIELTNDKMVLEIKENEETYTFSYKPE